MMSKYELYLILSRQCNIACGHCINGSSPNKSHKKLDFNEINFLADLVNRDILCDEVHFSGGEPTLFENEIQSLQNKISRKILYSITSNGSLGGDLKGFLDKISIDTFILSIDKWHQKFLSCDLIKKSLEVLRGQKISTRVNLVVSSIFDLTLFGWLANYPVKIIPAILIRSGRNTELKTLDKNATKWKCPSFAQSTEGSRDKDKIVYEAGVGFTFCCGPLYFNKIASEKEIVFASIDEMLNSESYKRFKNEAIENHLSIDPNLSKKSFSSPCEACVWKYSEHKRKIG